VTGSTSSPIMLTERQQSIVETYKSNTEAEMAIEDGR
jgi:hypothetical protein